ncbi:hypothetical protein [Aureliella helgolandensis]|uniref:hypothetical protein n=1 Tax=Aureliella helgolandensis TaxID=2527968 RepID=UPI00119E5563|nr:hypothetical protein [Aureliella helgolandensis]
MTQHEFLGGPLSGLRIDYDFARPTKDVETLTRYPNRIVLDYDTVAHPANACADPSAPVAVGRTKISAVYEFDDETGKYSFDGWSLAPGLPLQTDDEIN